MFQQWYFVKSFKLELSRILFSMILVLVGGQNLYATELLTNAAHFSNSPKWLNSSRVNRVVDRVQTFMEWSIRRVEVKWYQDQKSFESAHSLGPFAIAVTVRSANKILLGPQVTELNFDTVFGHELVHVISGQKFKEAIPSWLEEGVANFISKNGKVDYQRLSQRLGKFQIEQLSHPTKGSLEVITDRYMASQAMTEMIASKCDFRNLLRMSVQRKMESYLAKICQIPDLSAAFQDWLKLRASSKAPAKNYGT